MYRRLYGLETKGKRLSMVPGSYAKDGTKKTGKGTRPQPPERSSPAGTESHTVVSAAASTAARPLRTWPAGPLACVASSGTGAAVFGRVLWEGPLRSGFSEDFLFEQVDQNGRPRHPHRVARVCVWGVSTFLVYSFQQMGKIGAVISLNIFFGPPHPPSLSGTTGHAKTQNLLRFSPQPFLFVLIFLIFSVAASSSSLIFSWQYGSYRRYFSLRRGGFHSRTSVWVTSPSRVSLSHAPALPSTWSTSRKPRSGLVHEVGDLSASPG